MVVVPFVYQRRTVAWSGSSPHAVAFTLQSVAVDYWCGGAVIFGVSRSVRDTALLLDVLHGGLPGEPYRQPNPPHSFSEEARTDPGSLRIALMTDTPDHGTPVDAQIVQAVESTGKLLESLGHTVELQPVPYDFWPLYKTYTAIIAAQTTAFFDAMAGLVGWPATADDMANLYWTMIAKGRQLSAAEHSNHIEAMRQACCAMLTRMVPFDAWLMPTLPMLPRTHGYYDLSLDIETYDDTRMGPELLFHRAVQCLWFAGNFATPGMGRRRLAYRYTVRRPRWR